MVNKQNSYRKYKDSVFTDLFGKCKQAKQNFLSLYNALSGNNIKLNDSEIIPVILKNTVYRGIENDVSMVFNGILVVLVEQQSTINENMPLRFLEYISEIYKKILPEENRYLKKKIKIPKPECYVIYNGFENYPEEKTLKLSEMFYDNLNKKREINLEICVKVYNINKCKDSSKLFKCIPLYGYKKLVEYAFEAKKEKIENPVDFAVSRCIKEGFLSEYLKFERKAVQNMFVGDYDYEMDIKVQREEAAHYASVESAKKMLNDNLSIELVSKYSGLPVETVKELSLNENNKYL